MRRVLKFLLLSLWQLVSASSEFIVVEGSFGDEWKDSVLVGEYKRVERGSLRARDSQGKPIYKSRNQNQQEIFIRYEPEDGKWYFQSKNDLNSRLNYANLLCSSDVQDPSQCRIRKCEVWKNSGWSSCGSVFVRDGGREVLQKDRRESYAQTKINNEARENNFPKMIFVEGDFGDAWKTSNLGGLFKEVQGKSTANMDGRPVFQKADKSDFFIAYYAPRKEWGFRNGETLGKSRSYAYITTNLETYHPVQLEYVEYTCNVWKKDGSGKWGWHSCGNKDSTDAIKFKPGSWNINQNMAPTLAPRTTQQTKIVRITPSNNNNRPLIGKPNLTPNIRDRNPTNMRVNQHTSKRAFCELRGTHVLADFSGQETNLDQRWLIFNQPWSNVRKYNGIWLDGNNRVTKYNVHQVDNRHNCAYYSSSYNMLVSESCHQGMHTFICEFRPQNS
ncbi:Oidioi.mRNA.OKI2018_I69.chr2.g4048.t1.cds [Oikopleura dioica]|uniref:Oidioi.mRNA.OKI2018_I69.chr2.g4048.t1.cds n=1 Tax=Oikopleura dioica TaxID=34765 RepID=A0ABN7T2S9_OIKDI|nr:Oidioi.mRNA.OKI2018_I69.chr2.g4048.t1.cds [Oikopleura dioica]